MVILDKIVFVLLLVLLVLTPLPYGTVETWSTAIWEVLVILITILWGVQVVIKKRLELTLSPLIWPLLGLLVVAAIQLIPFRAEPTRTISLDPFATLDAGVKLFVMLLLFLLVCAVVNTDERRHRMATTIIVVCAIIAMIGIGQSYLGRILWPKASAGYGPFVNRNHFAGFLEMGIGLAGARVLSRTIQREKLVLYVCYLIVMCTGLVLCASRGGFLALAGVVILLALTIAPKKQERGQRKAAGENAQLRFVMATVILVILAFGAMFLTSSDELMQRFAQVQKETADTQLADEKFSRKDVWEVTIRMIKDHPILGVGLGAYQYAYTRYDKSSGILRAEQAHNDYLQIVADAGVVGGLLALAFLVLLFAKGMSGLQTNNASRRAVTVGALAGCFGIAVHSFVDFNLQITTNAQLFLVLAALATTKPLARENGESKTSSYEREQFPALRS